MRLPLSLAALMIAASQEADPVEAGLLDVVACLSCQASAADTDATRAVTYGAAIRNLTPVSMTIRGRFAGEGVTADRLAGRSVELLPGARAHLVLGNGPAPAMSEAELLRCLTLTCG